MILLLEAAAADAPDRTAVVTPERAPTYGALLDDARRIAASLQRRGITRFAVAEPDAAWVMGLLAGAALAGAEPCQFQPDTPAAELATQAAALGHTVVVTRRQDLHDLVGDGGHDGGHLEALRPEDLASDAAATAASAAAAQSDPPGEIGAQPLMIRTTGTTGLPKAARHDWRVLTQTVAGIRPAPTQRWLLAYGLHQFAGIQILLHVVASQATLVAPFPRQPKDGLEAMIRDGVTCVSATPTYWRFLLTEARSRRAELPPLEQITLGGEASPADLLDDLRTTFPGARISQVYASTELGSITSVRDGRPGIAVADLFSEENPTANVRVTDGELWVRPAAGMLGYAGQPNEATAPGEWRPTGDLVEIVDGRVLFRGRTSEVINVGGVKVHPLPVEERIAALDSVAAARVFGRPSKLTGFIVAAEIVPAPDAGADHEQIRTDVNGAVSDLPRAWQPRHLSFVEAIETKGGKTVRGTAR
jgi:acyl-CoA synthetase (AMP-forming)/AMP-acid ligase II